MLFDSTLFCFNHPKYIIRTRRRFHVLLKNLSSSCVNMDHLSQRYEQSSKYIQNMLNHYWCANYLCVYNHWHDIHVRILILLMLILILNLISIFLLFIVKENKVYLTIHCITSCLIHIISHIIVFLFPVASHSILKYASDVMSNLSWVGMEEELHALQRMRHGNLIHFQLKSR